MTPFWLVIVFCVQGGGCENRLVDQIWGNELKCYAAAFALVQARVGYRPMFTCTSERPDDVPLAPPFVAPEHWALVGSVKVSA